MGTRHSRARSGAADASTDDFNVGDEELPYPYNRAQRGQSFAPYNCSACGYSACSDEFPRSSRSLPLLSDVEPGASPFRICPAGEGPNRAELLSPTKTAWRSRVTHTIRGRTVTACMLGGVLHRAGRTQRNGTLISESQLRRELYLQFHLEDNGLLDDLNLACLVEAPHLHGRVFKIGDTFIAPRRVWITTADEDWEERAHALSLEIQGSRPGFLSADIARAIDPRQGVKMFDENQFLAVPFNLAMPLQEQWDHIRPWLDDLVDYAYRFTKTKRPRSRPNLYRDIYAFLRVRVQGSKVASVAREIFRGGDPAAHQNTVREAVRKIDAVVKKAGIVLPTPGGRPLPK